MKMKKMFIFMLSISVFSAYAKSTGKFYSPMQGQGAPYDVEVLKSKNGQDRYAFKVDGAHRSCKLFGTRNYRAEIISCEKDKLHVNVHYSSKTDKLCDPITDDGVKVEVSVPQDCDFSNEYGNIVTSEDVHVGADDIVYEGELNHFITDVNISCNLETKEFESLNYFMTEGNISGQYYFGNDIELRIGDKIITDSIGRVYLNSVEGSPVEIGELSISPDDLCRSYTGRRKEQLVRDVEINLYENYSFHVKEVSQDYKCENVGSSFKGRDWIQVDGMLSLKGISKDSNEKIGLSNISYRGNTCKNSNSVKSGLKNIGRNILLPFALFF
jgi:hypothetical protein